MSALTLPNWSGTSFLKSLLEPQEGTYSSFERIAIDFLELSHRGGGVFARVRSDADQIAD